MQILPRISAAPDQDIDKLPVDSVRCFGEMSAFPIINRQYYGNAPTGTIYGWQMLGAGIGMASGSFLGGVLRDLTGDYTLALVCSFVLSLMGTLAILVLPSTAHRQIPEWEQALPPEVRAPVHGVGAVGDHHAG